MSDLDRLLELAEEYPGQMLLYPKDIKAIIERVKKAERAQRILAERGNHVPECLVLHFEKEAADEAIQTLETSRAEIGDRLRAAEAALRDIAQYHPDWKGQHVNNAPNRAQLIDRAFYAIRDLDESKSRSSVGRLGFSGYLKVIPDSKGEK